MRVALHPSLPTCMCGAPTHYVCVELHPPTLSCMCGTPPAPVSAGGYPFNATRTISQLLIQQLCTEAHPIHLAYGK